MDDEFDEDDLEVATPPAGTVWSGAPRARLHWTDAPVVIFGLVENLADAISLSAEQIKALFQAHANHLGVRRQVAQDMQADIEAITQDRP